MAPVTRSNAYPTPRMSRSVTRRGSDASMRSVGSRGSRGSVSSDILTEIATRAASSALDTMLPGAGSAVRMARQAYKSYSSRSTQSAAKPRGTGKSFTGVSNATYGGKFKRAKRKLSKFVKKESKFMAQGYTSTTEIYGKVDDANCVYIGHSTFDPVEVSYGIAAALLRKLFKKAGFNPDSPDQELLFADYNDAREFKITLTGFNGSDGLFTSSYITVNNDTLTTVTTTGMTVLKDLIYTVITNQTTQNIELDRLAIFASDFNVSQGFRLVADMNLKNEIITISTSSEITIQNRTKSESGSLDAESIDNQPLKGRVYEFKQGVPKSKQTGLDGLSRLTIAQSGVILQQSVDLVPARLFKEPPNPTIFTNCVKSGTVSLEPGTIKKNTMKQTWSGYLNNLIQGKLSSKQKTTGGVATLMYTPGKLTLYALEERLNTGSANLITLNYEMDRKVMVMAKTVNKPVMLQEFKEAVVSNTTA